MRPARISKIIIAALILFVLASAAGITLFVYFFPRERLLSLITTHAEDFLKRKVSIREVDYGLRGILLREVILYDGKTSKDEVLARALEGRVNFSISSLFRNKFDINYITIKNLDLTIEYKNGESNIARLINDIHQQDSSDTNLSYITLDKARIHLKNPKESLRPLTGSYLISAVINLSRKDMLEITDCAIVLPSKRGTIRSDTILIKGLDKNFILTSDLDLDACALPWVYTWGDDLSLPFQNFNGSVSGLTITRSAVKGKARGTSLLTNSQLLSVNGNCTVTIPEKHVFITSVEGSMNDSSTFLNDLRIIPGRGIIKLSLKNISVNLRDIDGLLPFMPREAFGFAAGWYNYENGRHSGELKIKDGGLGSSGKLISKINDTIIIRNNTLQKENISMSILENPASVSIATLDGNFRRFVVNIASKKFTLPSGDNKKSGFTMAGVDVTQFISGRVTVEKLTVDDITLQESFIQYHLTGKQLTLDRFNMKLFGGNVKGTGVVDFYRNSFGVDLSLGFDRMKVQNIANLSKKMNNRFFGTATGSAEASFRVIGGADITKSLKGKMEFTIHNGKVANTGIQNGLGIWLSELKYKLKDLEFNTVHGNFNIIGNNYYINSFSFTAPDIRLNLAGYLNKSLEGDIKMDLEFTKNFILDLPNPAFLQLNKYRQGGWYSIPFHLKGNDITESKNIRRLK